MASALTSAHLFAACGSPGLASSIKLDRTVRIGDGSFGNLFSARWKGKAEGRKQRIAVKEVNASRLSEKARRQLHREIELHLETKHRYILSCHGAYFVQEEEDTFVHLVLERAAGDLGTALRVGAGPAVAKIAPHLVRQLLCALAHLHDVCCVVHSDVKPSNVLLALSGEVRLCDLGAAARLDGCCAGGRSTLVGSPAYSAPEVVAIAHLGLEIYGARYSFPADVFSVGVLLVELLTGGATMPFSSDPSEPNAQPSAICFRPPHLEPASAFDRPGARSLVLRLLSKQPFLRPTCAEALEEFGTFFSGDAAADAAAGGDEATLVTADACEHTPRLSAAEEAALRRCLESLARGDGDQEDLEASMAPDEPDDFAAEHVLLSPPPPPAPADCATDSSSTSDDASPMSLPSWTSSMVDANSPEP